MAEMRTYQGSCHCGAVKFEVSAKLEGVLSCNCSLCGRRGSLLAFVPASQFNLIAGADAQTEYRFNKHKIQHLFCKTCGVASFARGQMPDGSPMVAINTRCLPEVDLSSLPVKHFDGKSM